MGIFDWLFQQGEEDHDESRNSYHEVAAIARSLAREEAEVEIVFIPSER